MRSQPPSMNSQPTLPWWRVGMVWLVLAGPAIVVVAGIVTVVIAIQGADPVLSTQGQGTAKATAPAGQARNHVVTPTQP